MVKQVLKPLLSGLLITASLASLALADAPQTDLRLKALQIPMTESAQTQLKEVEIEKAAFMQSFDWGERSERVEKNRQFQLGVKNFSIQSREITRDMYAQLGHHDLAAREQKFIDRMTKPLSERIQPGREDNGESTQPLAGEESK